ncbi:tRNA (guanosine(37)-N1)-methyltransferase TrmD [Patescibacteria group bacterium]|nr:tRNA (guanosine(37)-N1)-methyltransferase TrmD [Patescibacteria group bacterium]MBU1256818.1 tRNA (guanosine(37)-N1)-methyltransferase TrmD [Patescibacteria group bacterium]MBU1457650.1 tRNA (guanosine(37)-N1)-methyltransferase TrmD [Patescibacteria group bacterium]
MRIDVLTLFPEMFEGPFSESILKRAQEDGKIDIRVHNLRDWAEDKHRTTDLPPYGGGPGMVMKIDVIDRAVEGLKKQMDSTPGETSAPLQPPAGEKSHVVLLDTKGSVYNQRKAVELSRFDHLILIAGHYEGVDHRVHEYVADEVVSIGEFVLTGGEIPAMVVVDSVVRLVPGVLGNAESLEEESYSMMMDSTPGVRRRRNTTPGEKSLEYPQYTRPEEYKDWKVPEVLLSGDHKKIEEWRRGYFLGRPTGIK